ncbi:hypothetical protein YC2023_018356 [Brassica napus]
MDGIGLHNNVQSLDSYLANIRLRLCRLKDHVLEVPCANANVTCFAMQRHLHQCKYKSTLEGRRVCPFSGCSFIGTYHKLYAYASSGHYDDMQMIECGETMSISFANHQRKLKVCSASTLSFARMIIARANSASSEPPPEPFVVPSFMGPATEVLILINMVETVGGGLGKQLNNEPVLGVFQSAGGITIDNLASRITQLEEVMHGKTPAHDRFSNTNLPAKLATPAKVEDITGETIVKGIEGDKEEGKPVREGHPDNPEEKNAGEDMEEELPLEGKA